MVIRIEQKWTYLDWVKLDTGLDDINRRKGTVGDTTADTSGSG